MVISKPKSLITSTGKVKKLFYLNGICLKGIFTAMIGFVTWPPFCTMLFYKGGQVTKPIIVVKISCKLLYVIQVKEF